MYLTTRLAFSLFLGLATLHPGKLQAQKIDGVCFSAPPREDCNSNIAHVEAIGANWIGGYKSGHEERQGNGFSPQGKAALNVLRKENKGEYGERRKYESTQPCYLRENRMGS